MQRKEQGQQLQQQTQVTYYCACQMQHILEVL